MRKEKTEDGSLRASLPPMLVGLTDVWGHRCVCLVLCLTMEPEDRQMDETVCLPDPHTLAEEGKFMLPGVRTVEAETWKIQ